MKVQQDVQQGQGIDTSMDVVKKPNYLAALDRYAADFDARLAAQNKAAPSLDSAALQQSMKERAGIDAGTLSEIEQAQAAIDERPDLFADGNISAEDMDAIRGEAGLIERITSLRSNFRRKSALAQAQQRWLNKDLSGLKPETVEKINAMYNIKFADEPIVQTYGEDLYKTVMEQTGGKAGVLDFVLEAARRKQSADIKYAMDTGAVAELTFRNNIPQLLSTTMAQATSLLKSAWDTRGVILGDEQAGYMAQLDAHVAEIKTQAAAAAENARANNQIFDLAKINADIDKQRDVLADLGRRFGKDYDFTSRMNSLLSAMGKAPILGSGTDFTQMVEVTQRTGYPVDVVINLLQQNPEKMRQIMINNGLPPLSNDVMSEFAKRLTDGIHMMATMDASKLGDPSLARFQQYLAGAWAGSTKGAPKQAVSTQLDTLGKSTDPVQTGVYFAQNPAFGPNVDAHPELKSSYVAAVRNGVMLMMSEIERLRVTDKYDSLGVAAKGPGTYMVPNPNTSAMSPYQPAPDNIVTGIKAWKKYLNSPEALRMLGPELRDEFNAALEGRSVTHGYSQQRIAEVLPTLDGAADIDLEMHAKGIKQALFRTRKSDPQYKVLQQAALAVDTEIESRKPVKETAPAKKTEPQAAWKPPTPAVTAKLKAQYDPLIDKYAAEYDVPAELAKAIALQESKYDPNAVSEAGAKGLMQLMDATGAALGLRDDDVFDPEKNIRAGIEHLARLFKVFREGDHPDKDRMEMIVAAYNAGEGTVKRAMQGRTWAQAKAALPRDETREYIKTVLK